MKSMKKWLVLIALFVIALQLTGCYYVIGSDEAGVSVVWGVTKENLQPGDKGFYNPLWTNIVTYTIQDRVYEASTQPEQSNADYTDYSVDTTTNDGQTLPSVGYTIRFRVKPDNPSAMYNTIGGMEQIVTRVVKANSRVRVRNVLKQFDANDLYSGNVTEAEDKIFQQLNEDFAPYNIEVTFFGLRNIQFEEQYLNAVEAKQIENENIQKERNILEQKRVQAEQKVVEAEAAAKQQLLKAEAEAESNELLTKSLSNEAILWEYLSKWNGELPTYMGGNNDSVILPFGQVETQP